MERNGLFFVWRPEDFEFVEQFCQTNGFQIADIALVDGISTGKKALGAYHYVSNSHASGGHVFCGVRKLHKVGILTKTYGKMKINEDPASGAANYGPLSGKGLVSRIDFGVKTPTGYATLLYNLNVA